MNEQLTPAREAEIRVKLEREAKAHGSVHFVPPKAGMIRDLLGEIDRLRAHIAELEGQESCTWDPVKATTAASQHYDKVPDPADGCHWCACGNRWPCKDAQAVTL